MPLTILITGFGPFPGAPVNPTERLVQRLARIRRPALADVRLIPHVFATSFRAVERDLPRLIAAHAPDAILMFGLAGGGMHSRSKRGHAMRCRCCLLMRLDASPRNGRLIAVPKAAPFPAWVRGLVQPLRARRLPARLSHDAGRYVCNFLCWQALDAAATAGALQVAFVHVPTVVPQVAGADADDSALSRTPTSSWPVRA